MTPIEKKFWRGFFFLAIAVLMPFVAVAAILGVLFTMAAGWLINLIRTSIAKIDTYK